VSGPVSEMPQLPIAVSEKELAGFCKRNHIRRLALFGSSLRGDFGADSDIDVLVEFEPGRTPGLIGFAGMEIELSELFGGRKIDLNTPNTLSRYFRDEVLAEARVLYE
jgi:predicted nucleotidyltransferase